MIHMKKFKQDFDNAHSNMQTFPTRPNTKASKSSFQQFVDPWSDDKKQFSSDVNWSITQRPFQTPNRVPFQLQSPSNVSNQTFQSSQWSVPFQQGNDNVLRSPFNFSAPLRRNLEFGNENEHPNIFHSQSTLPFSPIPFAPSPGSTVQTNVPFPIGISNSNQQVDIFAPSSENTFSWSLINNANPNGNTNQDRLQKADVAKFQTQNWLAKEEWPTFLLIFELIIFGNWLLNHKS
jgi:hypothetical protein